MATLFCSHDGGAQTFFYVTTVYSGGDRFVQCNVRDSSSGYSATNMFRASQIGATSGSCSVGYDLDTPSFGYVDFGLTGTASTPVLVTYHDTGSASDGSSFTFAASECSTN